MLLGFIGGEGVVPAVLEDIKPHQVKGQFTLGSKCSLVSWYCLPDKGGVQKPAQCA